MVERLSFSQRGSRRQSSGQLSAATKIAATVVCASEHNGTNGGAAIFSRDETDSVPKR